MEKAGLTIGKLAGRSGLSRSTLLYYDRLGLLRADGRSAGNYRLYSQGAVRRLEQICVYRQMGIPLPEIAELLDDIAGTPARILRRRLQTLAVEIAKLQEQQCDILKILKQKQLQQEDQMLSKERWVEIMRAAGFNDDDMHNWHIQFEKLEPQGHDEFLQSLGIDKPEIERIRKWSAEGKVD